jgi:hypothetical protein
MQRHMTMDFLAVEDFKQASCPLTIAMRDYHVFSMDDIDGEVIDHGVVLDIKDIPWAGRQLWAPDVAYKNGKYYLYFPLKDKTDIFRIGVAISDKPEGSFVPQSDPIKGSYSIDPAVLDDGDGNFYMYFGGLWGGQLQRYRNNKAIECGHEPADDEPALCARVVKLTDDMLEFAEGPRDVLILDEKGEPLKAGDHKHRFFEASWMHKYNGKYYFSFSVSRRYKNSLPESPPNKAALRLTGTLEHISLRHRAIFPLSLLTA